MPSATFRGQGQRANPDVGVYVVMVYPNGDRALMRVEGAVLTVDTEWPEVAWWREPLSTVPHLQRITLEGYLGDPMPYSGPLPDEPAEVDPPRRAISGTSPIALGPGA